MMLDWTAKIDQLPPRLRYVWLPKEVEPDWDKMMTQLQFPGFHVLLEPLGRGTNFLLVSPE